MDCDAACEPILTTMMMMMIESYILTLRLFFYATSFVDSAIRLADISYDVFCHAAFTRRSYLQLKLLE